MAECTIYDKLRYIAETKDLIKAAIEAQDVEVLESATFRQYAEYITEIRKVSSVNGMQGDVTITAADLGALTEIPSEYITETELNEKGYLTAVPDVYITEDELSSQLADKVSQNGLNEAIFGVRNDIPTNVSELTNDSGYITLNEVPKVDLSGYALKSEIPDISVKQDKLTAGNGISITDNVISLDYEYDLFEVVQSLPTENISDNKVYLLLDSNGSEENTYVEYLYVNGQWEELGKFKVNIDLSGYATEEWVNSQGFLKEHQDISNLATKTELNTKQDVISDLDTIRSGASLGATALQEVPSEYATEQWVNSQGFLKKHQDISNLATKEELNAKQDTINDLDTIRSGAAKGATALQEVPSTYAKKTDILSAKTDTRYTTFEVQNPILSGNTIVLQNEVTDSRKYHTLGFDKTITASVPVQKYINITRNYNGVPSMDTNIESGISFDYNEEYDVGHMYGDIPFTLDKINAVTNLLHYEVSYADNSGETIVDDVIYDPNTKLLSVSDGRFSFAQIRKSDNGQHIFGGNTDGNEYIENGRWYYNFEQHPLQEGVHLIFEPYYSSNLFWNFSLTLNGMFYQESSVTTDDKPERLNDYIRYSNNVKAYILTDKNTTFKTINGQQITGNGDITIDTNVDLSDYATKTELATKQDVISDLDTIRSGAAKGATALQSVPSGYATEQWVNEQGFLKEHQDISNLATKDELNAKQDVINDLETIRSGAELGATALQSVPDTYALKSEIKTVNGTSLIGNGNIELATKSELNAKQDTISDLETIRSGAALGATALQSVPSEYATEQWVNEQGFLKEHQDISNLATKTELATKQDVISDLETIRSGAAKGATALQSVPDTYALKSEIPDITTKQDTLVSGTNIKTINGTSLLGSGNIEVAANVDLSSYATKEELNAKQDTLVSGTNIKTVNGTSLLGSGNIEINASAENVPTLQTTPQGTTNNYIYSTGTYDKYGVISNISNAIIYSTDKASIKTYKYYWGSESSNVYQNWSINGATTSDAGLMSASDKSKLDGIDLSTKQDTLVSGTNIKTVNGISLLGEGNITISCEGSADLSGYYTKAEIDEMIGGASSTITEINNLVG